MTSLPPRVPGDLSLSELRLVTLLRTKLVHNLRFMQIKMNRFANMFIMLNTLLNTQT